MAHNSLKTAPVVSVPTKSNSCSLHVQVFDGTCKLMAAGVELLIRIRDGNQKELVSDFYKKPSILFEELPFYNNFGDNYAVLISGGKTDPATVYVLRWIAGRHAGVPEFNPPYSIVREDAKQPEEPAAKASKKGVDRHLARRN